MNDTPLNPAGSGRSPNGQFAPGNRLGKGNPLNRRAQQLRNLLLEAATDDAMRAVLAVLEEQARAGAPWAVKEWLDRMCGKPQQALELTGADGESLGLPSLTVILMDVLAGFPEARVAVAARLLTLSHERTDDAGGGP